MNDRAGSGIWFVAIGAVAGVVLVASFFFMPHPVDTSDAVAQLTSAYAKVIPQAAL